jgi:exosome complex component CSL4
LTNIEHAFRPGDLVLARVLSLGDTRRYILGTAEPHLGVLYAKCATSGQAMIPLSWQEMQCPVTGTKEFRHVAKPNKMFTSLQKTWE